MRAGTSHATLLAYEHGRIHPRVDTAARIIEAAGRSMEIHLIPRLDVGDARAAKGRELADVLLLAAEFPAHPRADRLDAPIFGRVQA
jgi:transcriptional regulator with XRE-family HTH domain